MGAGGWLLGVGYLVSPTPRKASTYTLPRPPFPTWIITRKREGGGGEGAPWGCEAVNLAKDKKDGSVGYEGEAPIFFVEGQQALYIIPCN